MRLVDGSLSILALDPGGTTGWALYTAEVLSTVGGYEYYKERFNSGQLGPGHHHLQLWHLLEQWTTTNTIIVCESFEFRRNEKDRTRDNIVLDSKEYIGIVNLYEQYYARSMQNQPGVFSVTYQTAALGKAFWKDEKLQAVGRFAQPKTQWPHANDAMRHLLHYMTFELQRRDLLEPLKGL